MASSAVFGTLVIVKRNGQDGSKFPLKTDKCVIGRSADSDVRIQMPQVSQKHCRIDVLDDGRIMLVNLSTTNPTELNGVQLTESAIIEHGSVFTVIDRAFRWEFPKNSAFRKPLGATSVSNGTTPSSSQKSNYEVSNDKESPYILVDNSPKRSQVNDDVENTDSPITPLKRAKSSSKETSGIPSTSSSHEKYMLKRMRSELSTGEYSSLKKVSFGPNLSPEQFDLGLPSITPLKKGGRPPSRRPSMPKYYGNPILTPVMICSRNASIGSEIKTGSGSKTVLARDLPSPKDSTAKKSTKIKNSPTRKLSGPKDIMTMKASSPKNSTNKKPSPLKDSALKKPSSSKKNLSFKENDVKSSIGKLRRKKVARPVSKSILLKSGINRLPLKSKGTSAISKTKSGGIKMLLGLDNAVKIVAPSSLDSKKSAALRTIHAGKLKMKKSKSKSPFRTVRRNSTPLKSLKIQMPFKNKSTEKGDVVSPSLSVSKGGRPKLLSSSSASLTLACSEGPSDNSLNLPAEMFVSPLSTPGSVLGKRIKKNNSYSAIKRFLKDNEEANPLSLSANDSLNVSGVPGMLETPPDINNSNILKSRTSNRSAEPSKLAEPIKSIMSKKKSLDRTTHLNKSAREIVADYTDIAGLNNMFKSPRKSPKSDYTDVHGLKRIMRTPPKSPKSDYSHVHGLKRLMKTPRKSPTCDYSDVYGLKRLMKTPAKSPQANYANVSGVKRLLRNHCADSPKSEYLDVFGLKRLMRSPRKSPKPDYSDVSGLEELVKTPDSSGKYSQLNYVSNADCSADVFRDNQLALGGSKRSSTSTPAQIADGNLAMNKINVVPVNSKETTPLGRTSMTPPLNSNEALLVSKQPKQNIPLVWLSPAKIVGRAGTGGESNPDLSVKRSTRHASGTNQEQKIINGNQETTPVPNSISPKIIARTLRSSARKKAMLFKSPTSINTPSLEKISRVATLTAKKATRSKAKMDDISVISPKEINSPSGSPTMQSMTRKTRKDATLKHDVDVAEALNKEKRMPKGKNVAARKAARSPKMIASPVEDVKAESTESIPLRKTRSAKKVRKEDEFVELENHKSPIGRITRGSRRKIIDESPRVASSPSPKIIRKTRKANKVVTPKASPEKPSPKGRSLRRRAK